MASKYSMLVLVISACCLMAGVSTGAIEKKVATEGTCSKQVLDNLEATIELCTRNVPAEQFADPSWECARTVSGYLEDADECDLSVVPDYLEDCLYGFFLRDHSVKPAVKCIKLAIESDICCSAE
ncbi:uncharacterized protein LOC117652422 [Thrips palmi]|uniref:Uncharacterized protein LOC117652422 n=1 Tax=Thrips palmi TaxID=161013 RepID=A0A6P9A5Q0_THRPL|nr:uncharacterized protein LOC117652422 [Thrips palmi]